jgi:hypothetical protein
MQVGADMHNGRPAGLSESALTFCLLVLFFSLLERIKLWTLELSMLRTYSVHGFTSLVFFFWISCKSMHAYYVSVTVGRA